MGKFLWLSILLAVFGGAALPPVASIKAVEPPAPPLPSERQLRWHELEFYGFVHFTINTFTD
jgi:hypothetical protein